MDDLRDRFEEVVCDVVSLYDNHDILRELLEEKLEAVMRDGFDIDNAIFEVSDNEAMENQLYDMKDHIREEILDRISTNFRIAL